VSKRKSAMRCPVHGRKMRKKAGCPDCARSQPIPGGLGATGETLVQAAKARYPDARSQALIDYYAAEFASPDPSRRVPAQAGLHKLAGWPGQDVMYK
jgi:hypothetical protein